MSNGGELRNRLAFFHAILMRALETLILLSSGDSCNALLVLMFVRPAFFCFGAFFTGGMVSDYLQVEDLPVKLDAMSI